MTSSATHNMTNTHRTRTLLGALLLGTALTQFPAIAAAQQTTSSPTGPSIAQTPTTDDEVIATGVFIPNEKQITSEITSVLDEDTFAQIGAGDIASALTRVTGLSLSQGKFVIVRGLNERYAAATLNGAPLPSPEPLRRVAPLDLFPTSVLSDVVVQKTYSPEFAGEFGGGAINLRTRALPEERFLELSVSGSYNTATSLRQGLVYPGGDLDFLGFDDGLRDLPPLDANGVPTENFDNFDTLVFDIDEELPFNGGARISAGDRFDLDGGQSIGVLATVGYDNGWQTRRGENNSANIGANGELNLLDGGFQESTENSISLNGMLGVGVEFDENNTVQFVGLVTRQSSAEARSYTGTADQGNNILRQDFSEWIEREVYMGQILGEHFLPGLNDAELTWRASYAEAGRDAPYERRVNYENFEDGRGFRFHFNRLGITSNQLTFSDLDDTTLDLGVDLTVPFDMGDREVELKIGGAYLDKSRDSVQADFFYFGIIPEPLRDSRIDLIFSDAVVDAGILDIRRIPTGQFPDLSFADLETFGAYASLETEIIPDLRISGGLRFEDGQQDTAIAQALVPNSRFQFESVDESYILPAATATYTFADNWQLRLAASKTINRPQFRELTPSIFVNTDTDDRFIGNPFLQNSESINLDARLEYYFGPAQFFTVGGFYKDLENPIEEFIFNGLGESNATSFINAPSAELYGIEVEFERKFAISDDFPFANGWLGGQDFVIRSNYTFTDSSVSADGTVRIVPPTVNPTAGVAPVILPAAGLYTDGRKLQGQSDHLVNLQFGIENYDQGWDAFLLLNYTSQRIRAVEDRSNGLPSIDEQLPLSLDFVLNVPFEIRGGDYEVGFKIQNILDDKYEAFQELGDTKIITDDYNIGTTFAASLKRRF
ncbi:MAG: TonB-dependent receptor [Pseudomonadota bacterium]